MFVCALSRSVYRSHLVSKGGWLSCLFCIWDNASERFDFYQQQFQRNKCKVKTNLRTLIPMTHPRCFSPDWYFFSVSLMTDWSSGMPPIQRGIRAALHLCSESAHWVLVFSSMRDQRLRPFIPDIQFQPFQPSVNSSNKYPLSSWWVYLLIPRPN